jgi:hypothetical protein
MPGRQPGWGELFDRVRSRAETQPTSVYDADNGLVIAKQMSITAQHYIEAKRPV